ncbi:Gtpase-activating protein gaca [Globisporangium polare]
MSSCLNLRRTGGASSPDRKATHPPQQVGDEEDIGREDAENQPQDDNQEPMAAASTVVYEIGMPYDLKHDVHIHYNFKEARFEGVPDNFAEYLASTSGLMMNNNNSSNSPKPGSGTSSLGNAANSLTASFSSMTRARAAAGQRTKRSRTGSSSTTTTANPKSAAKKDAAAIGLLAPSGDSGGVTDPKLLLNQHFKLHFRQVPRVAVSGYEDRIPAVLVMLQEHFLVKQGYLLPHIFRESPNKADRDQAMREINTGTFYGASHDVRVLADLIKLWFRELPVPIFHEIRADRMEQIISEGRKGDNVAELVTQMLGPLEKCIVMWLADLLAHVAEFQELNHMGVDQLAIIIAPNLVRIETENPMLAVALSKASVDLFRSILRARFQARRQVAQVPEPDDVRAATLVSTPNSARVSVSEEDVQQLTLASMEVAAEAQPLGAAVETSS